MQNSPKRNNARKAERSETLIIPHITKEMVALAQKMANEGKSRAEIEAALAALQPGAASVLKQASEAPQKENRASRRTPPGMRRQAQQAAPSETQTDLPTQELPTQELPTQELPTISQPAVPPAQESTSPPPANQTTVQGAPEQQSAKPVAVPSKKESAKATRHAAPRTRAEAQAELNEHIRADHVWLSNPVMVRGLGLAPVVGAAIDGQRALMLCIASLILITMTRGIAVGVCHLTKNRFRAPIYAYTAALLYIPTYILLSMLFGTSVALLGIYLPVLVLEPVVVKRMEFSELESVSDAWRHGFNNSIGMCVVLFLVGCLRELLATGAVFGHVWLKRALLPLAAQPAGGFILVGVIAAVWCAVANVYTDYKREEVRRLYDAP